MLGLKIYLRKNVVSQGSSYAIGLSLLLNNFTGKLYEIIFVVTLFHRSLCANFITLQLFLPIT